MSEKKENATLAIVRLTDQKALIRPRFKNCHVVLQDIMFENEVNSASI